MIPRKTPIGVTPRFIVEEGRSNDLANAIVRYLDAGLLIPQEWVIEYNEIKERLNGGN